MSRGLVRYQKCGTFDLPTFSCYRKLPLLASGWAYPGSGRVREMAWRRHVITRVVLMPEQARLLAGEPRLKSQSATVPVLKQIASRELKPRRNGVRIGTRKIKSRHAICCRSRSRTGKKR